MQLFGAARSLLDQVAILDSHADLMAQREQQPQFRGSEAAVVRSTEEQNAKSLFLGLQADGHDAAQPLSERQFAEATDGLFLVQGGERIVTKIAETQQAAETSHQADQVIV